jgi:hypothetical protein
LVEESTNQFTLAKTGLTSTSLKEGMQGYFNQERGSMLHDNTYADIPKMPNAMLPWQPISHISGRIPMAI